MAGLIPAALRVDIPEGATVMQPSGWLALLMAAINAAVRVVAEADRATREGGTVQLLRVAVSPLLQEARTHLAARFGEHQQNAVCRELEAVMAITPEASSIVNI